MSRGNGKKANQEARIARMVEVLDEARVSGKEIRTKDVMTLFDCSKPTAIDTKRQAEMVIAARGIDGGGVPVSVTMPARAMSPADSIAAGIDMIHELAESSTRLRQLSRELQSQIAHATYFVLGCPEGHEYPGLCARCGAAEVAKLSVRNQPRLLQIGYLDIAKLAESAVKTEMAAKSVVDSYDNVISRHYTYAALENFVACVHQAIATVVPAKQKEIKAEIMRLQMQSGSPRGA